MLAGMQLLAVRRCRWQAPVVDDQRPDETQDASEDPVAGPLWKRMMAQCRARGVEYDAVALATAALDLSVARDPLQTPRVCIRQRNGRECRGERGCSADCDIPF